MTAAAFAMAGQALAETLMDSAVTITRAGTPNPPDPVTGKVATSRTTVYTGPARLKPFSRVSGNGVTAGDAKDSSALYTVSIPIRVTDVHPGDVVHLTASTDQQAAQSEFRVLEVERSPQITARRLTCALVEPRR